MADLLYRKVFEALRDEIAHGIHPIGARLPSEAELSERFAVSAITVKRALNLLRDEGYIVRRPRLGTVVVSATPTVIEHRPIRTPLIGCVLTNFDDTFGTRVLEGVLDAAHGAAQVIVKRTSGDERLEAESVRALVDAGADGIILLPSSSEFIPPPVLELVTRRFPVVILDRIFDGVPVSAVCSDNVGGAKRATERLFELGHERVGLVTSASHVSTTSDRRDGYLRAHAEHHLPLREQDILSTVRSTVPGANRTPDDDVDELERFLRKRPDMTGCVVSEYNIALMLREAALRLGRTVPSDLSIVCFDHPVAFADRLMFRFDHVAQDQHALGARAVEQVLRQIADPGTTRRIVIPVEIVPGQSTAAR